MPPGASRARHGGGFTAGVRGSAVQLTELPDDLQKFLKVMVGMEWPEGNETQLRQMAGAYYTYAEKAQAIAEKLKAARNELSGSMRGRTADEAKKYLDEVVKSLEDAATAANDLGGACQTAAADVQKGRIMLVAMATMVMIMYLAMLKSIFTAFL